ncbi:hypothetical protein N7468_008659 [Penicillium chermesinum]|uniref:Galactose oxidase/kelch, beta-propeller n=1 Tax=Penicillium chermesinum TaxID=63820 RepID=A0A9W9TII4_9EURO|nr:uncharacterized protein N7468_008659 [Penicillium chermesinum]KAJ5224117.1 hypothetical protein N7468_008659 [Penicillium chermesinum]KAJ6155069.1 hypothetical protein N7470_005635 [Penicillium chermesinum]
MSQIAIPNAMEPRGCSKRSPPAVSVLSLAFLASLNVAAAIPYTPSTICVSSLHNDSIAYLLRPSGSGSTEFLSLNISSIDTGKTSFDTLLQETPFHYTNQSSTFIPTVDDHGVITVYAGDCHGTLSQSVWQFQPDNSSSTGNGTWNQLSVNPGKGLVQPNYLAAGFSFTSADSTDTSIYSFGGMCPFANSTDETWVSAANYSQNMIALKLSDGGSLDASITGSRAPPVPEAGMAVVPLSPTSSRTEKQQDFLLIGGHTQHAFLNMSQLAIFSVPQESWSFVKVNSAPSARTELAIRDGYSVEPRSGHAAVLSEDGTKVFVIGGWVGDTSVPADPQLAVLELGENYGGTGEWTWNSPSSSLASEAGIAAGTGIFGHSAAMLPGGVLMIAGGYSIPKKSSKRATSSVERNPHVYLYNSTSGAWVTSYTNPVAKPHSASPAHTGDKLNKGQKIGLGVGLSLGLLVAFVILAFVLRYHQKRRVKGKRDSQLRELALGAERAHFWGHDEPYQASSIRSSQMSEKTDPARGYAWATNRNGTTHPWKDQGDGTERTGLLAESPSPKKSPQNTRPTSRAWSYRPSGINDYRRSELTSEIHPIDEREEDEAIFRERLMATIPKDERPHVHDENGPFSDTTFATPRSTIFGVGLGPFYTRRKGMGSVDEDGRSTPTKSERTSTGLSEGSNFSFSSGLTGQVQQARAVYVNRPLSWSSSGGRSVDHVAAASIHSRDTTHSEGDGMIAPSEKSYSGDSYSTAQTTMLDRQAENTSLMLDNDLNPSHETSPSKLPPSSKPRTSGVFETVRRALTLTRRDYTVPPDLDDSGVASGIDRRSTVVGLGLSGINSGASTPRRAVSASAELFRRKQSAKNWNAKKRESDNGFVTARSTRDDLFIGAPGYLGDDETMDDEWDGDGVENRNVQMAYLAPRERLRVVNSTAGDMDNISQRSTSRGLSGSNTPRRVSN